MTSNRVALITGASRGIGKAITLALAESGLDVVINFASQHEAAAQVRRKLLDSEYAPNCSKPTSARRQTTFV